MDIKSRIRFKKKNSHVWFWIKEYTLSVDALSEKKIIDFSLTKNEYLAHVFRNKKEVEIIYWYLTYLGDFDSIQVIADEFYSNKSLMKLANTSKKFLREDFIFPPRQSEKNYFLFLKKIFTPFLKNIKHKEKEEIKLIGTSYKPTKDFIDTKNIEKTIPEESKVENIDKHSKTFKNIFKNPFKKNTIDSNDSIEIIDEKSFVKKIGFNEDDQTIEIDSLILDTNIINEYLEKEDISKPIKSINIDQPSPFSKNQKTQDDLIKLVDEAVEKSMNEISNELNQKETELLSLKTEFEKYKSNNKKDYETDLLKNQENLFHTFEKEIKHLEHRKNHLEKELSKEHNASFSNKQQLLDTKLLILKQKEEYKKIKLVKKLEFKSQKEQLKLEALKLKHQSNPSFSKNINKDLNEYTKENDFSQERKIKHQSFNAPVSKVNQHLQKAIDFEKEYISLQNKLNDIGKSANITQETKLANTSKIDSTFTLPKNISSPNFSKQQKEEIWKFFNGPNKVMIDVFGRRVSKENAVYDHIWPFSKGGATMKENAMPMHIDSKKEKKLALNGKTKNFDFFIEENMNFFSIKKYLKNFKIGKIITKNNKTGSTETISWKFK